MLIPGTIINPGFDVICGQFRHVINGSLAFDFTNPT